MTPMLVLLMCMQGYIVSRPPGIVAKAKASQFSGYAFEERMPDVVINPNARGTTSLYMMQKHIYRSKKHILAGEHEYGMDDIEPSGRQSHQI